jgi:hypothetical protein
MIVTLEPVVRSIFHRRPVVADHVRTVGRDVEHDLRRRAEVEGDGLRAPVARSTRQRAPVVPGSSRVVTYAVLFTASARRLPDG